MLAIKNLFWRIFFTPLRSKIYLNNSDFNAQGKQCDFCTLLHFFQNFRALRRMWNWWLFLTRFTFSTRGNRCNTNFFCSNPVVLNHLEDLRVIWFLRNILRYAKKDLVIIVKFPNWESEFYHHKFLSPPNEILEKW